MFAWEPEPTVLIGCGLLALAYVSTAGRRAGWGRRLAFLTAAVVLLLALISPLDTLADHFLFSAHMLQHLLLLEVVAPLCILAIPAETWRTWLRPRAISALERVLRQPGWAWIIGFTTLAVWHLPRLYDLALRSDGMHALEHVCFMVSACIFWYPVLSALASSRLEVGTSIVYLFARMAANLLLGSVIYAAPLGLYAAYAHVGVLPFGLTALQDQRLGGILMWAPTLGVDLAAVPLFLVLWLAPKPAPTVTV